MTYTQLRGAWMILLIVLFLGHSSNCKVTQAKKTTICLRFERFRTITAIWFHGWLWHDTNSFQGRGSLSFFRGDPSNFKVTHAEKSMISIKQDYWASHSYQITQICLVWEFTEKTKTKKKRHRDIESCEYHVRLFADYTISLSSLCRLIWKHWTTKMLVRYMMPSVCLRLRQFSQLSLYSLYGAVCLQLTQFCDDRENVYFILLSSSNRKYESLTIV